MGQNQICDGCTRKIDPPTSHILTKQEPISRNQLNTKTHYITNKFTPLNVNFQENTHLKQWSLLQTIAKRMMYQKKFRSCFKAQLIEQNKVILNKLYIKYKIHNYDIIDSFNRKTWKSSSFESDNNYSDQHTTSISKHMLYRCQGLIMSFKGEDCLYIGNVNKYNIRKGEGSIYTLSGYKYQGVWENDSLNTNGSLASIVDNTIIIGEFKNNAINGEGSQYWANAYYKGNFVDNERDGSGIEETEDFIYVGDFKNNKREGEGKISYTTKNETYEGEFKNDKISGNGYYVWENNHTYRGEFLNEKMNGNGIYTWPGGDCYKGSYVNNIKEGYGEFTWSNGDFYKGMFKNNMLHGAGKLKKKGCSEIAVEFKNGKLMKYVNKASEKEK